MREGQILALWTMAVTAGVIADAFMIAVAASLDVAAEDVGHFPDGLGHGAQSFGNVGVTTLRGRPRFFLGWASVSIGRRSSGLPVRLMVWGETEV